ncbi:hypothetical protein [Cellulosimicrobium protaetiae]|uniref:Uncharacterized protein n=1 Tax=Cellulosimicrobium protaetiae TaxID=2587808 RepID=A0A6M5UD02_9MICO|nr:hypothetical protein [Cellulosimicrobium protaetiae]QJW34948.1 hypothetical protein FIC82_000770 [Cellulosimicrobium protaetiae]
MGDDEVVGSKIALIEAQLRALRTIALAQSRWREVAAAVAAGTPLPLDGLTPEQEETVRNLQLRRLSPQDRERVRAEIDALEAALRRLTSDDDAPEPDRPRPDGGPERAHEDAPPDARWFAVAPLSGTVFRPGRASATGLPRPRLRREEHALRLMNDYAADWPLWPATSATAEELEPLLGSPLTARLRRWARTFNDHYSHVDGWDDPAVAAGHRAEADRLLAALREALPPPWTVSLDYWETTGDGR